MFCAGSGLGAEPWQGTTGVGAGVGVETGVAAVGPTTQIDRMNGPGGSGVATEKGFLPLPPQPSPIAAKSNTTAGTSISQLSRERIERPAMQSQ